LIREFQEGKDQLAGVEGAEIEALEMVPEETIHIGLREYIGLLFSE